MKAKFNQNEPLILINKPINMPYNMIMMEEKECGTPMSFFTVGLESFQSPPLGTN